jgi:hypothetical protein
MKKRVMFKELDTLIKEYDLPEEKRDLFSGLIERNGSTVFEVDDEEYFEIAIVEEDGEKRLAILASGAFRPALEKKLDLVMGE